MPARRSRQHSIDGRRNVGIRDLLRIVRGHERWMMLGLTLSVVAVGLSLVQPLIVKQIIEAASDGPVVWQAIALLIAIFAIQAVIEMAVRYALARTGEGIVLGIRLNLIDRLLRLRMAVYDRHRVGDLISRATSDASALRRTVAEGLSDAVTGAIGIVGILALMLWLDWVLFVIVLSLITTGALILASVLRGIRCAALRTQHATGEITSDLERALSVIRTIRASQAEPRESQRLGNHARSVYAAGVQMAKLDAVVAPASAIALNGSFLVVLLVGGIRVTNGTSSVGELAAFLLYLTYLTMPIAAAFQAASAIQQGLGALQRINDALALSVETDTDDKHVLVAGADRAAHPVNARARALRPVLELRDVSFGYEPHRPVLRGVSLCVPPRGRVALIGVSGAGKSTIFALTERFYDPDRGDILFHGQDVRTIDRTAYRARIGLVEQHVPVLHGSLRENLTYARPDATDTEVKRAVQLANLDAMITRLPRGLDSEVGEHGMMLSGGERQRVVIARSVLSQPDLLLLDEPTSHLDPVNEAAFDRALEHISQHCALLLIAHRFTTVSTADHVIVLDEGKVIASGTHDELIETSEFYRRLANTINEPAHNY